MKRLLVLPLFLATTLTISSSVTYALNPSASISESDYNYVTTNYESLFTTTITLSDGTSYSYDGEPTFETTNYSTGEQTNYTPVTHEGNVYTITSYDPSVTTTITFPNGEGFSYQGEEGLSVDIEPTFNSLDSTTNETQTSDYSRNSVPTAYWDLDTKGRYTATLNNVTDYIYTLYTFSPKNGKMYVDGSKITSKKGDYYISLCDTNNNNNSIGSVTCTPNVTSVVTFNNLNNSHKYFVKFAPKDLIGGSLYGSAYINH